ncbi:MAG: BlaI/MecI/CopY family transcriptional regulator [Lachnospiraceae bacterium]|nr:BlaI/MecI/CopY family transcriptional regulator [Lachnospiraceae bacterium]
MLFSDITDCEMLVFRCIQESKEPISLVRIMDILEEKYQKDWKRSTVCTFIAHLIEKGYVTGTRSGRTFYYSSAINNKKFTEEQTRQFIDFWFGGSVSELMSAALTVKKVPKKDSAALLEQLRELEK